MTSFYDDGIHAGLKRCFDSGRTRPIDWRLSQLERLADFLREEESAIFRALEADFHKSPAESFLTEIGYLAGEIRYVQRHLRRWMRARRVSVPLHYMPARAFVQREPLGVVLIIGAWNYPLQLCLAPLVGALAGGNCAVIKPSELAPATSKLLSSSLPRYLDPDSVRIVEGGQEQSEELLRHHFDHIFFTGSSEKGRLVLQAAACHLTPVTLELGGKCPCIVTPHANLRIAARRIVWAKFLNAGQTCIAPDYLLVHESVEARLLVLMREAIVRFYGNDPQSSPDYARIIDDRHFRRLSGYLQDGTLLAGGEVDLRERYISPSIIRPSGAGSPLMKDEMFGPVLPVISYSSLEDAVDTVRSGPESLAVYLFSRSSSEIRMVRDRTRSSGLCCNDLMFQASIPGLPFGGRGESGMGFYHGRAGFETFTVPRSVLLRRGFPDPDLRYPPYSPLKFSLLRRIVTIFS
jgi:acyl-CoA reductase-like NAD-dependent aldehyde dehydrogenase